MFHGKFCGPRREGGGADGESAQSKRTGVTVCQEEKNMKKNYKRRGFFVCCCCCFLEGLDTQSHPLRGKKQDKGRGRGWLDYFAQFLN